MGDRRQQGGRAVALAPAPGDRRHGSDEPRGPARAAARPAIPTGTDEAAVARPARIRDGRDVVERLRARPEAWRAVAARHEGTAGSLLGALRLAATLDRLKP